MFGKASTSSKSRKPDEGAEWFTLAEIAAAFGVTEQGFAKTIRPLIAAEDIRSAGGKGLRIRCRGAIDAYAAKQAAQEARKADPLLTGNDSAELERYRAARADLAVMDRDERRTILVNRAALEPAFRQYSAAVRRAGELLQRTFGDDAAEILNAALNDAERSVLETIGGAS